MAYDKETVQEAGLLLCRDLELSPSDLEGVGDAFLQMRNFVAQKVAYWMQANPEQLFNVLYRLDISESKARLALGNQTPEEPAVAVANLIMEREIEKVRTRREYRSRQQPENGGDGWDDAPLVRDDDGPLW